MNKQKIHQAFSEAIYVGFAFILTILAGIGTAVITYATADLHPVKIFVLSHGVSGVTGVVMTEAWFSLFTEVQPYGK